jgi:hypothetical protein
MVIGVCYCDTIAELQPCGLVWLKAAAHFRDYLCTLKLSSALNTLGCHELKQFGSAPPPSQSLTVSKHDVTSQHPNP